MPLVILAQRLTTKDGLPHRWVNSAFQDSKGYMWLSTYDGLTRYDGNEFMVYRPTTLGQYTVGANRLLQVIEMPGYQFYFSTQYGIFHFDPIKETLECFKNSNDGESLILLAEGLSSPFLEYGIGDWMSNIKPLTFYWLDKRGKLTSFADIEKPVEINLYPVLCNRNEAWFWDFKHQYYCYDFGQKSWKNYPINLPVGNTAPVNAQQLFYVPDGDMLRAIPVPEHTAGLTWTTFSIEPGKAYWLYGQNSQKEYLLYRYEVLSGKWETVVPQEKLKNLGKADVLQPLYPSHFMDAEGNIWFTDFLGVLKVQKRQELFQNYLSLQVDPAVTPPVGISARTLWEAPDGTIFVRDENNKVYEINPETGAQHRLLIQHPNPNMPASDAFQLASGMMGDTDGTLWLLTQQGLLHYFPADKHFQFYENTSYSISIFDDHRGRLWLGDQGTTLFNKKTGELKPIPSLNKISLLYGAMLPEENTFWAFSDTGLIKINTLDFSTQSIKLYKDSRDQRCIVLHKGWLWLGTSRGLEKVDPKTFAHTNFDRSKGLPGTFVFSIVPDGDYLWLGTSDGLCRFNIQTNEVKNFYVEDGLSQNEFNSLSTLKTRDGRIFMGGLNGLNAFYPTDLEKKKSAPLHINLSRFSYFDEKKDSVLFLKPSALQGEITLAPTTTTLSLYLMLDSYLDTKKNQYAWQMEGLDKAWFYAGNQSVATYRQVPPGTYTFRAKAADAFGTWSENELAITITVLPFFYQTWWFTVLVLLAVAGIGFAISRYRLQRLLEMERMRTRIASDLHDEVGSMLSGLSMQAELLEMSATEKDRPRIEHIGDISRTAVSKMRDLVWSIDSRRDKLKNLLERMQEQATDLLQPQEISCHFELGELPLEKKLPVDIRQHLFLIFKESLTNITRHSNADEVTVRFGNFDGRFEMSIHDNGNLPPKERTSTGLGLSNMEMRAGKLGAKLAVKRSEGFTIVLTMKPL